MTPCRFDFYLPTNGDYVEELSVAIADVPIDLTGYTFYAQVRSAYDSTTVLGTLTLQSNGDLQGFYIVDAANGLFQIRIDREAVLSWYESVNPSTYVGRTINLPYDMTVRLPNGDFETWLDGYMIINKGITYV